jgi:hypothetical protein
MAADGIWTVVRGSFIDTPFIVSQVSERFLRSSLSYLLLRFIRESARESVQLGRFSGTEFRHTEATPNGMRRGGGEVETYRIGEHRRPGDSVHRPAGPLSTTPRASGEPRFPRTPWVKKRMPRGGARGARSGLKRPSLLCSRSDEGLRIAIHHPRPGQLLGALPHGPAVIAGPRRNRQLPLPCHRAFGMVQLTYYRLIAQGKIRRFGE